MALCLKLKQSQILRDTMAKQKAPDARLAKDEE
jgi:hypothetical protein